jgi:hypothetical protein
MLRLKIGLILTLALWAWTLDAVAAPAAEAPADSVQTAQPRAALWRSLALPGWGQVYNGKAVKAVLFGTAAVGVWGVAIVENRRVGQAGDAQQRQDRAARRNTRFLFVFVTYTVAALDAYIDAHLADVNFNPEVDLAQCRVGVKFTKKLF